MTLQQIDFDAVVPKAQAGDLKAHNQLMAAFYAWSVTQAKAVVRESEMAKDVAVEFWAWLRSGGINECRSTQLFYSWMATVIRNMAINRARKKRVHLVYGLSTASDGNGGLTYRQNSDHKNHHGTRNNDYGIEPSFTDEHDLRHDLSALASQLKPLERKVLALLLDRATPQEIADECGFSRKRAQNVISGLRKQIKGWINENAD
jgi:RNA polymerase sigma factor (sigma-70 family)